MLCRELTLCGRAPDHVKLVPLHCRSWNCEICFPKRLRDLKHLAAAGAPTKFITLTVNPRYYPEPFEALTRLIRSWKTILQRAKRERKAEKIEYLGVVELTKKGVPHLHILARAPYIDQKWLSDRMYELMRSPVVHVTAVRSSRHVARYVSKYVAKGPARIGTHKRFFRSRGYAHWSSGERCRKDSSYTWELLGLSPADAYDAFAFCDWRHSSDEYNAVVFSAGPQSRWPSAAGPPAWLRRRNEKCQTH